MLETTKQFFVAHVGIIAALCVIYGVIMQTYKICRLKRSEEIHLGDLGMRLTATLCYLMKFWLVKDPELIVGQCIFLAILLTYIFVVVKYRFWPGNPPQA